MKTYGGRCRYSFINIILATYGEWLVSFILQLIFPLKKEITPRVPIG
jgi:hypothetical protein